MMGSLNGDIVVMRNGRSTSQVSVYNYPEHLNPFYEDDQHKRLRFWKISKKDNEGRRNSFSIGNLKDMWTFKSFRMKKKSSTLGINKTSESPPTLRRDYAVDNGYNTFDHRLRNSNTSSINGDSFQRNAIYRSSLQTLPTSNDRIGLNRNDGYRSTIQVTRSNPRYQIQQKQQQLQQQQTMGVSQNRRYVYGGSVTPQPLRITRTNIVDRGPNDCDNVIIRGSSQSSMVSSNPFESDDDENEDINTLGMRSVNGGSTTTLTSQTPRKKRRAPAPPASIHGRSNIAPPPTIRIESSHDNTQDELCIKEDTDIANLTAEIESFVKTKNNDDAELTINEDAQTTTATTTTTSTKSSDNTLKAVAAKTEGEQNIPEITLAPTQEKTDTSIASADAVTSTKEKIKPELKTNGQITTEIITVTTSTKTTMPNANKPVEKEINVAQVSKEAVTKNYDESEEIISNGAIPKKPNNNSIANSSVEQQQSKAVVTDLCIKEPNTEELTQKPVPFKRQTKPEAEVGNVECIHVHVESPRATPRNNHLNGLSSFKTTETAETTETITTKTPFVLTSPPTQRRNLRPTENEPVIKETVKILATTEKNERTNELTIKEECINTKPEIMIKPTLSPKPITKGPNGNVHGFAEIHKPMRKFTNAQNGHVRKASREENITPPTVPQQKPKEEEKKINITISPQSNGNNREIVENIKPKEEEKNEHLNIVETTTATTSSENSRTMENAKANEIKIINCETKAPTTTSSSIIANQKELQRRDDEFEFLYRPKPASHMEWKRSTLAPLEANIPPEKRKSVKDIIESINRSQRLLNAAANKDFPALQNLTTTTTNSADITHKSSLNKNNNNNDDSNLNENLKILDERQKEIERLVEEMAPSTNVEELAGAANSPSPSPSNCNNEYTEAQKLDNSEIFEKCKVKKEVYDYREASPISSNLDWNPVPKPKRTKPAHE